MSISPPWLERRTGASGNPDCDPDSERPELAAVRHDVFDETDIDFNFEMQSGFCQPEAVASSDIHRVCIPRRPKAVAKMLVRSGRPESQTAVEQRLIRPSVVGCSACLARIL